MIVFFLPNGLGDSLMAAPVLKRLIALHGAERLAVVVASHVHRVLLEHLTSHKLKTFNRFDGRPWPHLRLFMKLFAAPIDVIYAPMLARRWKHLVFFLLLGKRIVAPASFIGRSLAWIQRSSLSQAGFEGHQSDYFVQFVAQQESGLRRARVEFLEMSAGIAPLPRPAPSTAPRRTVAVGVSCGLLERHKIPSPELFASLLNALARRVPLRVMLIGTSSDGPLNKALRDALDPAVEVDELIDLPFNVLLQELAECDIGISGTTGQGHMMAAAQLPMLVLSGVTDPYESGPYAERVAHLRHDLPCGPCYQETFRFGCGRVVCMEQLNVKEGADLALRLLDESEFGKGWHEGRRLGAVPVHKVRQIRSIPEPQGCGSRGYPNGPAG
jgi:ADP-heptose:LPS heptosyltransferase